MGAQEAALRKERLTLRACRHHSHTCMARLRNCGSSTEGDGRAILKDAVRDVRDFTKSDGPLDVTLQLEFARPAPTLIDMSKDADLIVVGRTRTRRRTTAATWDQSAPPDPSRPLPRRGDPVMMRPCTPKPPARQCFSALTDPQDQNSPPGSHSKKPRYEVPN